MRIHTLLAAALPAVAGLALLTSGPAQAAPAHPAAAPACSYICVWSGANYTGTEAVVPPGTACHSASSMGMDKMRSAVVPDYYWVQFYASSNCTGTYVWASADNQNPLDPPAGSVHFSTVP